MKPDLSKPWRMDHWWRIVSANGFMIVDCTRPNADAKQIEAIGKAICGPANLHDELVLCCKIARSELTQGTPGGITDALRRLEAVLKKAEEQRT